MDVRWGGSLSIGAPREFVANGVSGHSFRL
jgi:hypothetical protein